jgi:hypothetical protein
MCASAEISLPNEPGRHWTPALRHGARRWPGRFRRKQPHVGFAPVVDVNNSANPSSAFAPGDETRRPWLRRSRQYMLTCRTPILVVVNTSTDDVCIDSPGLPACASTAAGDAWATALP